MAQLVQSGGLQRQGRPTWIQQHIDARFGPPLLLPLGCHQAQHGPAVAGALATIGQPLQRRAAAPQAHLGLLRVAHPADPEQTRPLLQCRLNGGAPGGLALGFGVSSFSVGRFDPDAPVVHDWPAGRGGLQQMAVVAAVGCRGCRRWRQRMGWQRQGANLGGRGASRATSHRQLLLGPGRLMVQADHRDNQWQQGHQPPVQADAGHDRVAWTAQWFSLPAGRRHGPSGLPAREWQQTRPVRC